MLKNSIQHLVNVGWPIILLLWNLYLYPKIREQDKDLVGLLTIVLLLFAGLAPAMVAWFLMNLLSLHFKAEEV